MSSRASAEKFLRGEPTEKKQAEK